MYQEEENLVGIYGKEPLSGEQREEAYRKLKGGNSQEKADARLALYGAGDARAFEGVKAGIKIWDPDIIHPLRYFAPPSDQVQFKVPGGGLSTSGPNPMTAAVQGYLNVTGAGLGFIEMSFDKYEVARNPGAYERWVNARLFEAKIKLGLETKEELHCR